VGILIVVLVRESLEGVVVCCFVSNVDRFDVGESEVCLPAVVIG
jgi:hypothetical protein